MKKFAIIFTLLAGCAASKPCLTEKPPVLNEDGLECKIIESPDGSMVAMICKTESFARWASHAVGITEYANSAYEKCGPRK